MSFATPDGRLGLGPALVAEAALQRLPDPCGATLLLQNPRRQLERWLVANVLAVTTFQFDDPNPAVVLTETDDGPIHPTSLAARPLGRRSTADRRLSHLVRNYAASVAPGPSSVALAIPGAVLVGHALAYLASGRGGDGHGVDHGYILFAAPLALALALAALAANAMGGTARVRNIPVRRLVIAQWTLFVAQEVVEHLLAGHEVSAALHSRALWFGLAAQVAVAFGTVLVLSVARTAGERLYGLSAPAPLRAPAPFWGLPSSWATPPHDSSAPTASRGPPLLDR